MKFLILTLFLVGCSRQNPHTYTETTLDVTKLPECTNKVVKSRQIGLTKYVTFETDNGDVLYASTKGTNFCLKRKCKLKRKAIPLIGPQKRPGLR